MLNADGGILALGVLDNGKGMTKEVLRMALQFGNGTHLDPVNQQGIGKFGMGLPSSSISQAKKVEVWTWQNGIENAYYSYLDIDKIITQEMNEVPEPLIKQIMVRLILKWSLLERVTPQSIHGYRMQNQMIQYI